MKDYRKNMRLALVCFLLVVVLNFFLPRLLPGNPSEKPVKYATGLPGSKRGKKKFRTTTSRKHMSASRIFFL